MARTTAIFKQLSRKKISRLTMVRFLGGSRGFFPQGRVRFSSWVYRLMLAAARQPVHLSLQKVVPRLRRSSILADGPFDKLRAGSTGLGRSDAIRFSPFLQNRVFSAGCKVVLFRPSSQLSDRFCTGRERRTSGAEA